MNITSNDILHRFYVECRWIDVLEDLQEQLAEHQKEIEDLFLEGDQHEKLLAAGALAYIDKSQAVRILPVLMEALASTANDERAFSAHCISLLGEAGIPAVPVLIPLLKDDDCIVVECAARALGEIESPESIPHLIKMLGSIGTEDDGVPTLTAVDAATALGRIGPAAQDAVPKLKGCLQLDSAGDPFIQSLRLAAAKAIWQITGDPQNAVAVAMEILNHEDDYVCLQACRVLTELGGAARTAAEHLQRLLKHSDASVREQAAQALVRCLFG